MTWWDGWNNICEEIRQNELRSEKKDVKEMNKNNSRHKENSDVDIARKNHEFITLIKISAIS